MVRAAAMHKLRKTPARAAAGEPRFRGGARGLPL